MALDPMDPLRFHASGRRLSEEEFSDLLEDIIQSWGSAPSAAPRAAPREVTEGARLSGSARAGSRRSQKWLSRK